MKNRITGIILCGGRSTRMNKKNKAFLKIGEKKFIDIITNTLDEITNEIIIVSNSPEDFRDYNYKIFEDIFKKETPLAGIHSGLVNMDTEYGFVTACDSPFLVKGMLEFMFNEIEKGFQVVTPNEGTYYQPLCSIYSKECVKHIEELLKRGEVKVDRLFDMIEVKKIPYGVLRKTDQKLKSFININSPEELHLYSK